MAQLKDTIVSGNLRVTDTTLTDTLQVTTIKAPTSSGGTTYGPGTNGQILKSNGTMTYWTDMPTIPTVNNASLTLKGAGTTVTTFTANSSTNQSLDIVAGSNVTITPDATNHKITIASSYTNTDTKVKVTANTTTKGYLIASTTSPNGTAVEGIADTGVYLGTTAGSLYATTFYGDLSGNATSATTASKLGSSTVGSTRRPIYLNSGTATEANYMVSHFGNAGKSNMNDVGKMFASVGMANLSDPGNTVDNPMNGTTKSTSWHLYWDACYIDDPNGSNSWVAQIANKAGTAQWWVRSRKGGTITNGTEWDAGWEHLTITSQAGAGSATNPVYVDSNGHTQACTYSLNKTVPSNAEFTDANVLQSETTASQYRPIVFGATYSTDASALAATITGQTYVSTLLYAQPQNGILYANRMYLKAPGSKGQLNLITSKYNVMLRNDDSNTYFLVTAQNNPTGTWTSARPLTINNSTGVCSINGNAASANALNLTHGNELNFSKLASNGHVWFGYRWNTGGTETSGGTTITTYKFGNANGAGGLAGLEATTSTFKSGNFGDQLIVERTGGANMAGITFKNTSGVLGYIAANTVDGDLYHYGATDTSTMKYTILDSHNYTSYPLPRNIKHIHTASGTEGTAGWVKIARITVTNLYANHPMTFTIAQRDLMQYRIHLVLVNNGSVAAAAISQFIIARDNSWTDTNNNPRAYIIKPSDGIFDLYIRKTEAYDHIFVVDFTKADSTEGDNYSVTWTNVHAADSAITGGTEAVKKLYLPTTTNYAASSSVGGAATTVTGTLTNPTSETSYAVPFHTNPTTGSKSLLNNNGISYVCKEGTASALGWGILLLGNNVNSGTAGNKYGIVRMYPQTGNYYGQIRPVATLTGTRTYQLPDASGNVILGTKGSTSFWGLIDGDASTANWIRATSNGFIPSAAASFFQTATSSLGTNTWYFKNSYIQYMKANRLILGAAKTADGAAKGQLKFFSGNASDATGTVTLECVNDSARTGDYTVKLPTWNGTIPIFEKLFEGASNTVSLSYSDIDEYDVFLITVANSNATSEQVTVTSLWISNVAGLHDMPLIWGGAPTSSGGACNVTSGWIQLSKNSGTTTFVVAHKPSVAQMTSSGWTISSPTYNLYIRKIFGLKAYKRT